MCRHPASPRRKNLQAFGREVYKSQRYHARPSSQAKPNWPHCCGCGCGCLRSGEDCRTGSPRASLADRPPGTSLRQLLDRVQRSLPPNNPPNCRGHASGQVLINQTHTYRDLYFPINTTEKRWVDTIDGILTIDDIVKKTKQDTSKKPPLDNARSFFELLWLYDQVVVKIK